MKQLEFIELDLENYAKNSKETIQQFRDERYLNHECADTIEILIDKNFDGAHLNTKAVLEGALQEYTPERIAYVLAVRVNGNDGFDKRISKENEEWAKEVLSDVPEMYKNKKMLSPVKNDLSEYVSGHQLLANAVIDSFKEVFPKLHIAETNKPVTAFLKVQTPIYTSNEDKIKVDYDEFKEKDYICFKLETTDSSALLELTDRSDNGVSSALETMDSGAKSVDKSLYAILHEDGELCLRAAGNTIELTHDEFNALSKTIDCYTQKEFHRSAGQVLEGALNGEIVRMVPEAEQYVEGYGDVDEMEIPTSIDFSMEKENFFFPDDYQEANLYYVLYHHIADNDPGHFERFYGDMDIEAPVDAPKGALSCCKEILEATYGKNTAKLIVQDSQFPKELSPAVDKLKSMFEQKQKKQEERDDI